MYAHERSREGHRKRRGFTFIEVMAAVVVLMLGLIPIYRMFVGGARRARYSKMRAFAATLSQNYLERVRGCSLAFLDPSTPNITPTPSGKSLTDVMACNGASTLLTDDEIMNPLLGGNRVPNTPEFQALLERWDQRSSRFSMLPLEVKAQYANTPDMTPIRTRVLGILIDWHPNQADRAACPGELTDLTRGPRQMSLFAFAGESLFHPPPIQ